MEGVTFGLRYGLDRLRELGLKPTGVHLIGGGAKSAVWRQIVADVFDLQVVCPAVEEGPAFGAAIQAMWTEVGGSIRDLVTRFVAVDESTRRVPILENREIYRESYRLYQLCSQQLIQSSLFPEHRKLIQRLLS